MFIKAKSPMLVTPLGISMEVRAVDRKALAPIDSNELGMEIEVRAIAL